MWNTVPTQVKGARVARFTKDANAASGGACARIVYAIWLSTRTAATVKLTLDLRKDRLAADEPLT